MAQFVKKIFSAGVMMSASLACALISISTASAQQLQDPTRPSSMVAQAGDASSAGGPVLQSVLISPGRSIAIISGQTVKLGGQFGAAKLVRISEGEVVLRNGSELQTLRLFPSIGKRLMSDRTNRNPDNRK